MFKVQLVGPGFNQIEPFLIKYILLYLPKGVLGRREIENKEIKTRKPMHVLELMLVQVNALVSM
jgi:hypothetical protein